MEIFASYPEIEDIIFSKTGKNISLSFKDDKTVSVVYTLAVNVPIVGKIDKNINADITVEEIAETDVRLRYSMSSGMELLISGAKKVLGNNLNKVQMFSFVDGDNVIVLHLDKIAEKKNMSNFNELFSRFGNISFKAKTDGISLSFLLQNL